MPPVLILEAVPTLSSALTSFTAVAIATSSVSTSAADSSFHESDTQRGHFAVNALVLFLFVFLIFFLVIPLLCICISPRICCSYSPSDEKRARTVTTGTYYYKEPQIPALVWKRSDQKAFWMRWFENHAAHAPGAVNGGPKILVHYDGRGGAGGYNLKSKIQPLPS